MPCERPTAQRVDSPRRETNLDDTDRWRSNIYLLLPSGQVLLARGGHFSRRFGHVLKLPFPNSPGSERLYCPALLLRYAIVMIVRREAD